MNPMRQLHGDIVTAHGTDLIDWKYLWRIFRQTQIRDAFSETSTLTTSAFGAIGMD